MRASAPVIDEAVFHQYEANALWKDDRVWKFALEWDAIQPQRLRLIKPFLFLYTSSSAQLSVRAKIYSDSFPAPYELSATFKVVVVDASANLEVVLPNWRIAIDAVGNSESEISDSGRVV